jgi:hypothetical protein
MAFDLGQAAGGFTAQWDVLSRAQREQELVTIKREQADREKAEYDRVQDRRKAISEFAEVSSQPVAGYASSTDFTQLRKEYGSMPLRNDEDGTMTAYGQAVVNAVQNGSGIGFKPDDQHKAEFEAIKAMINQPKSGISNPAEAALENPFAGAKVVGSRLVGANFNPNTAESPDDRKMYLQDWKTKYLNYAKHSDDINDVLKADKIVKDKEFDRNADAFMNVRKNIVLGNTAGAIENLNQLMPSIAPGAHPIAKLELGKNGSIAGAWDSKGKAIPIDLEAATQVFASNDLKTLVDLQYKGREVGAKELSARADMVKGNAAMVEATAKKPYYEENANSLRDDRMSKIDERSSKRFIEERDTALGIPKDQTKLLPKEKEAIAAIAPVADDLWQTSRANGLKLTGSQAVNIAKGLNGIPQKDSKGKPVLDKDGNQVIQKTFGKTITDTTPDGMVEVRDLKSDRVVGYVPRGSNEEAAWQSRKNAANNSPTPSAKVETPAPAPVTEAPAKGLKVDDAKYIRSKNNKGGYTYTASARGLTKAQYQQIDEDKNK